MKAIKAGAFEEVVKRWLAGFEVEEEAYQALSSSSGLQADTWRRRLTPGALGLHPDVRISSNGWLGRDLSEEKVDEFLTAADLGHLWHEPPLGKPRKLRCEDCGKEIEPEDYRPLDLFRPQNGSSGKEVWDSTKQKWVRRPAQGPKKRARRNGRRFRVYDLCRRCAGEALRQRAAKNMTVMEGGKKRTLATKERLAPKRGGRPRLLDETQLRAAYTIYEATGLSQLEIARRLHAASGKGTVSGYTQSLLYGWRKLKLPLRDRGVQMAISLHGTDGTKSKHWKKQCKVKLKNDSRCEQWVTKVTTENGSHPAEDGLCFTHRRKAERESGPAIAG